MTDYTVGSLPYELQNIALGACFLGSGGGGKLKTSLKYIDDYFSNNKEFQNFQIADLITDLKDAQPNESGIVVAYMGAPQKMDEIKCPDAICEGIKKIMTGKKVDHIDYIIPVEIGPVSTITACLTALKMKMTPNMQNLHVLNVDGAGRAVPTLDLITYTTNAGISVNPTILCSENMAKSGEKTVYEQITLEITGDTDAGAASKMESLARPVLNMAEFDQKAGLVMWYFDNVTKLKEDLASVPGTLTFSLEQGRVIRSMQEGNGDFPNIEHPINDKSIYPTIKEMCRGKLISATTSTAGGFDVGVITIEDEGDSARHYTIIFQNESLILWDSNYADPLAMAPDLISYLIKDKQKQYVFTNGDIMLNGKLNEDLEGTEIIVYGIAAPEALKKSESNIMIKRKEILCNTIAGAKPNELLKHYMSVLNTLGYYGKYKPFWEEQTPSMR